jgi:hypothetical protein
MSNQNELKTGESQIILYKPNDTVHLELRFEGETVWLTQIQISLLFGVDYNGQIFDYLPFLKWK